MTRKLIALGAALGLATLAAASTSAFDAQSYRAAAENGGDAENGRKVFLNRGLRCLSCHGEPGAGGDVGPDLAGIGRKGTNHLIDALLDPAKDVPPGYGSVTVVLHNGDMLRGTFDGQDAESVTFTDDAGKKHTVRRGDIESMQIQSRMPRGLAERMTPQEFADLIAFLQKA